MKTFEERVRGGGDAAIAEAQRFFRKTGDVHLALRKIAAKLEELGIPYAVAGGMAVSAHGLLRTTEDVNVLVNSEGLAAVHRELEGLGYVPPFAGSKNLRDTETQVRVEFLVSGQFPGDGKPKPVAFPEPRDVAVDNDRVRHLGPPTVIGRQFASGMDPAHSHEDNWDPGVPA